MFGHKLRELREAKGWSQAALAKESGLSQKGISLWENNERVPNWDAVRVLCRVLGVSCVDFESVGDEVPSEPISKAGRGRPKKPTTPPPVPAKITKPRGKKS